jgi:hypothetical protein
MHPLLRTESRDIIVIAKVTQRISLLNQIKVMQSSPGKSVTDCKIFAKSAMLPADAG